MSRKIHPEHPEDEASGEYIEAVQPLRSQEPGHAVEDGKNGHHADRVSGNGARLTVCLSDFVLN